MGPIVELILVEAGGFGLFTDEIPKKLSMVCFDKVKLICMHKLKWINKSILGSFII